MFYETFVCFYVSKANLFVSVFVNKCLMVFNDVEYTIFKMFVTQTSNYLFVISFQLMFYKTLHCSLARTIEIKQSLETTSVSHSLNYLFIVDEQINF